MTYEDFRELYLRSIRRYRKERQFSLARHLIWKLRIMDGINKGEL